MRLFDLIEEDEAVGPVADGFGELTALLIAHVAGRRTDKTRHGMPFHVLGHVDADQGLLVVEHELGERSRELGLAHPGGPEEHERRKRPVLVGKSRAGAAERIRDRFEPLFLADHAFPKLVFDVHQLLGLGLQHLRDRNTGPLRHDRRDILFVHQLLQERVPA